MENSDKLPLSSTAERNLDQEKKEARQDFLRFLSAGEVIVTSKRQILDSNLLLDQEFLDSPRVKEVAKQGFKRLLMDGDDNDSIVKAVTIAGAFSLGPKEVNEVAEEAFSGSLERLKLERAGLIRDDFNLGESVLNPKNLRLLREAFFNIPTFYKADASNIIAALDDLMLLVNSAELLNKDRSFAENVRDLFIILSRFGSIDEINNFMKWVGSFPEELKYADAVQDAAMDNFRYAITKYLLPEKIQIIEAMDLARLFKLSKEFIEDVSEEVISKHIEKGEILAALELAEILEYSNDKLGDSLKSFVNDVLEDRIPPDSVLGGVESAIKFLGRDFIKDQAIRDKAEQMIERLMEREKHNDADYYKKVFKL